MKHKHRKLTTADISILESALAFLPHHGDFLSDEIQDLEQGLAGIEYDSGDDEWMSLSSTEAKRWAKDRYSLLWELHGLRAERGDGAVNKMIRSLKSKRG